MNRSRTERRWWLAALALVVLIYATLYFVRVPVEFLRERGLLRLTVGAAFALATGSLVGLAWKRGLERRQVLVLVIFAPVFAAAVWLAPLPEEKLHFLEYALLAGLLLRACSERAVRLGRGRLSAAWTAVALAGLAGVVDEGIQEILPNRYFDLRDIVWNVLASTITIAALGIADVSWRRELPHQPDRP